MKLLFTGRKGTSTCWWSSLVYQQLGKTTESVHWTWVAASKERNYSILEDRRKSLTKSTFWEFSFNPLRGYLRRSVVAITWNDWTEAIRVPYCVTWIRIINEIKEIYLWGFGRCKRSGKPDGSLEWSFTFLGMVIPSSICCVFEALNTMFDFHLSLLLKCRGYPIYSAQFHETRFSHIN